MSRMRRSVLIGAVGFTATALAVPSGLAWSEDAIAQNSPSPGASVDQRLDQLSRAVESLQEQIRAVNPARGVRLASPGRATFSENEPAGEGVAGRSGFALQSMDGDFTIRFEGVIQADGRFYTGSGDDSRSYAPPVNASGQGPAVSEFLLRRVRPILAGTLYRDFDFFLQPDFGGNTAAIYDAYLDIKPWAQANLRIGKFKTPLGEERLQADSALAFAERGLTADLMPQRDTGIELYGGFWGNAVAYQASFTNGVADGAFTPDSDANSGKDATFRVFALPFKNTGLSVLTGLGLGVAGSYSADGSALPTYKTATGQEQFFAYGAAVSLYGERRHLVPQANYYRGPLGLYAEFARTRQAASAGATKAFLTHEAWQAAATWVLTGERASPNGVQPDKNFDPHAGTWGALELAGRVHQLQIDPNTFRLGFSSPSTSASKATAYTAGVNWYLNRFVKFAADFEQTWFDGGNGTGNRPIERVVDARWQLAF
jgi:phosphate-selective porin OprO/OprP